MERSGRAGLRDQRVFEKPAGVGVRVEQPQNLGRRSPHRPQPRASIHARRSASGTSSARCIRSVTRGQNSGRMAFSAAHEDDVGAIGVSGGRCELREQPGARHRPVALDGPRGDAHDLCDLLDRHAGEIAQFDDAGLTGIDRGELVERLIEGFDVDAAVGAAKRRALATCSSGTTVTPPPRLSRTRRRA